MTTYIHYIRALKAGIVINDYNIARVSNEPPNKLHLLGRLPQVAVTPKWDSNNERYNEYSLATVPDVETKATSAPLAVVARIRLADKIRWQDGKRIVSEQWSGKAYPVTGSKDGFVLLDTGHGIIGRKAENVKVA